MIGAVASIVWPVATCILPPTVSSRGAGGRSFREHVQHEGGLAHPPHTKPALFSRSCFELLSHFRIHFIGFRICAARPKSESNLAVHQ